MTKRDWIWSVAIILVFVTVIYLDRFAPYARACHAVGGEPALDQQACYVTTIQKITIQ